VAGYFELNGHRGGQRIHWLIIVTPMFNKRRHVTFSYGINASSVGAFLHLSHISPIPNSLGPEVSHVGPAESAGRVGAEMLVKTSAVR
jgi:hypothetical protein